MTVPPPSLVRFEYTVPYQVTKDGALNKLPVPAAVTVTLFVMAVKTGIAITD